MKISISEEQKSKYYPALHERSTLLKCASDMMSNLGLIVAYGLDRLNFGMLAWSEVDKFPSFDHKDPYLSYDAKNLYFLATNAIFICNSDEKCPWTILPASISEIYFHEMLKRTRVYEQSYKDEKKSEYHFNKGMPYANLGVAQASQMKIDEGFANILKALIEDFGYSTSKTPEHDTFRRNLFAQFEDRHLKAHLKVIIPQLGVPTISDAGKFVDKFLESLSDDQRVFLNFTFARIIQNWNEWKEKENGFSANRLLAYTQDFCLFNEDLLKNKVPQRILRTRPYWTLKELIPKRFPGISVKNCGANKMSELDSKLTYELKQKNQPKKCLRILLILRNYSSHNISAGTSHNRFYASYEEIFKELIRAMCYIGQLSRRCTTA